MYIFRNRICIKPNTHQPQHLPLFYFYCYTSSHCVWRYSLNRRPRHNLFIKMNHMQVICNDVQRQTIFFFFFFNLHCPTCRFFRTICFQSQRDIISTRTYQNKGWITLINKILFILPKIICITHFWSVCKTKCICKFMKYVTE